MIEKIMQKDLDRVEDLIEKNNQNFQKAKEDVHKLENYLKDPVFSSKMTLYQEDVRFFSKMIKRSEIARGRRMKLDQDGKESSDFNSGIFSTKKFQSYSTNPIETDVSIENFKINITPFSPLARNTTNIQEISNLQSIYDSYSKNSSRKESSRQSNTYNSNKKNNKDSQQPDHKHHQKEEQENIESFVKKHNNSKISKNSILI